MKALKGHDLTPRNRNSPCKVLESACKTYNFFLEMEGILNLSESLLS